MGLTTRLDRLQRWVCCLLTLLLSLSSALPVYAGKLDLDLYSQVNSASPSYRDLRFTPTWDRLYYPGSPLNLRYEPWGVRMLSHAGYSAMATVGLIQSIQLMGGAVGAGTAAGFALIAAIQLYQGFKTWKERDKKSSFSFSVETGPRR